MAFMHEGGMAMWASLILFLLTGAMAVVRREKDGRQVATIGAIVVIASGLAGFATGLYNTIAYAGRGGLDRAEVLGIGLRESVHNLLFAGILALASAVLALALGASGAPAKG